MLTDPISDLIIQLKNASLVGKFSVTLPHSKMKEKILAILKKENFVKDYKVVTLPSKLKHLEISLLGEPLYVERMSKPGRRLYAKKNEIPGVTTSRGVLIVSTSAGLMSGREAKKSGVGGELLLKVWE